VELETPQSELFRDKLWKQNDNNFTFQRFGNKTISIILFERFGNTAIAVVQR
jgi:hypothetical protein